MIQCRINLRNSITFCVLYVAVLTLWDLLGNLDRSFVVVPEGAVALLTGCTVAVFEPVFN